MSTAQLPPAGNVSRLLTKFGASTAGPKSSRPPLSSLAAGDANMRSESPSTDSPTASIDIGSYDGGFEREDESRGQIVSGEAAADLALDSSISSIYNGWVVQIHYKLALTVFRNRPTREWHLTDFDMGRPLGKGKFGRVYMVRTKCAPRYILALKCLYKSEIVQCQVEKQIRREIEIQQNLRYAPQPPQVTSFAHLDLDIQTSSVYMATSTTQSAFSSCSNSPAKANSTNNSPNRVVLRRSAAAVYVHCSFSLMTHPHPVRCPNGRCPGLPAQQTRHPPGHQAGKPLARDQR